jgi:hypothetical protein
MRMIAYTAAGIVPIGLAEAARENWKTSVWVLALKGSMKTE